MQGNHRTPVFLFGRGYFIFRRAVASPLDSFCALAPAESIYCNLVGDHKGGVEAESEVTYYISYLVLIFLKKLARGGKGNLVDILVKFLLRHTYTVIYNAEFVFLFVKFYLHLDFAEFALEIT